MICTFYVIIYWSIPSSVYLTVLFLVVDMSEKVNFSVWEIQKQGVSSKPGHFTGCHDHLLWLRKSWKIENIQHEPGEGDWFCAWEQERTGQSPFSCACSITH